MSSTSSGVDTHGPGDMLAGRFRLVQPLGRGAMGSVWLTHDTRMDDEPIACKLVTGPLLQDERTIACLKREVLLTRRLRHPCIVAVYTFWEDDAACFITMEYVPGQSLATLLAQRDKPFAPIEILPWIAQICGALDYAHDRGVLHRDVKPSNILTAADGAIRLVDFGIARMLDDVRNRIGAADASGTVVFMSPEQLLGEAVDRRSDIYSLAATVYEMLAGRPPFSDGRIIARISTEAAEPVAHLPAAINDVLLRGLAKSPADRHGRCEEFLAALSAAAKYAPAAECAPLRWTLPDDTTVRMPLPLHVGCHVRLGSLLVDAGAITPAQLDEALALQAQSHERIGGILCRLGYATDASVARALESQLRVPLVSLEREVVEPGAAALITRQFALANRCLPLRRTAAGLAVAMADPLDFAAINRLEQICGAVDVRIAIECELIAAIERIYA